MIDTIAYTDGYYAGGQGVPQNTQEYWSIEERWNYIQGWEDGYEAMIRKSKLTQGYLFK